MTIGMMIGRTRSGAGSVHRADTAAKSDAPSAQNIARRVMGRRRRASLAMAVGDAFVRTLSSEAEPGSDVLVDVNVITQIGGRQIEEQAPYDLFETVAGKPDEQTLARADFIPTAPLALLLRQGRQMLSSYWDQVRSHLHPFKLALLAVGH